jgi:hypothetical protein
MKAEATIELEKPKALHMLIERPLLKQIEDYRHRYQYSTRVEAIKALIKYGLMWTKEKR